MIHPKLMSKSRLVLFIWLFLIQTAAYGIPTPFCGLENLDGKEILPCKYRWIKGVSNNLILLQTRNDDNPAKLTFESRLLDKDLKPVQVKIPKSCTLYDVILPESCDLSSTKTPLPDGTLFNIHGPKGFGLSSLDGKIILEPEYPSIGIPENGYLTVDKEYKVDFVLNIKTGEKNFALNGARLNRSVLKDIKLIPFSFSGPKGSRAGYCDPAGNIIIKPVFENTENFSSDRLAIVEISEKGNDTRKFAFINTSGKVISPYFESLSTFQNNVALIKKRIEGDYKNGFINRNFKTVVKPEYQQMLFVTPEIIAAKKSKDSNWVALDTKGKELFSFPDTTLFPTSGGKTADGTNLILCHPKDFKEIPKDSIYSIFLKSDGTEFLRIKGYGVSPFNEKGEAFVSDFSDRENPKQRIFDLNGKDLGFRKTSLERPSNLQYQPDKKLKILKDTKFISAAWKDPSNNITETWNRFHQLDLLLRNHDLIAMERSNVLDLLGGNGISYQMNSGLGCGNSIEIMYIDYDDKNRVKRWGLGGLMNSRPAQWFDENVIFKNPDSFFEIGRLTDKYDTKKK